MVHYLHKASAVAAATTALLGYCTALTFPHHHGGKYGIHPPRSEPGAAPLSGTIKYHKMESSATNTSTQAIQLPQNISTYLLGKAPNPSDPANLSGFIAQYSGNDSSSYFMPPKDTVPGAELGNTVPNRSFRVQPDRTTTFKTPGTMISGRIYVVDGHLDFFAGTDSSIIEPDPHNPQDIASKELWGFIELTHIQDPSTGNETLTVNLSFVDWVSLPLGMNVTFRDGNGWGNEYIPGLRPDGLVKICDSLTSLGSFWPKLCLRGQDNKPLRVMSPAKYASLNPTDKDAIDYYEPYIDEIWKKYQDVDLKINTQVDGTDPSGEKVADGQIVTCRVGKSDNTLHCDQGAGDFQRPVTTDIWGCDSGPFENPRQGATEPWSRTRVRPRLCAAFARSTLDLDSVQPSNDIGPEQYYQKNITNHYSRLVHENLVGSMGYAFSYDDVNPGNTENSAGLISRVGRPGELNLDILINA
ncbi:hypothetical protein GGS21DRAFT_491511 [Xylaria nigripes]|nr:hypothetical protein GGS21DRAFT_491511 [Xylaria nigripes]